MHAEKNIIMHKNCTVHMSTQLHTRTNPELIFDGLIVKINECLHQRDTMFTNVTPKKKKKTII
jgi:hypothetical protein